MYGYTILAERKVPGIKRGCRNEFRSEREDADRTFAEWVELGRYKWVKMIEGTYSKTAKVIKSYEEEK